MDKGIYICKHRHIYTYKLTSHFSMQLKYTNIDKNHIFNRISSNFRLSVIKNVSASSKGINSKGLHNRC